MSEEHEHRHEHGGRSSRDMLDAAEILSKAGLEEGMSFLDAGCGDGHVSLEAAKTASEVYAVDMDRDSLEKLITEVVEKELSNLHVVLSDLTNHLPLEDGKVDLCLMSNVFHGFAENGELDDVMPRLLCSLKNSGKLVVLEFRVADTPGPPLDVRVSPQDVSTMLEPYGLQVERAVDVGEWHYLVVLGKKE